MLCLIFSVKSQAQDKKFEALLAELPHVTYTKTSEANGYEMYTLKVKQPINHWDTTKGFFQQKIYLSHKNIHQPTVIVTAGYNVNRNRSSEVTKLLEANQILVEHRYFGESIPEPLDYQFLNLKQATADLHRIRQLFAGIYAQKWVSTGISKGGATTIFYRYFYPNDVAVSIPYVAPINRSYEESRIYDFLDSVGTQDCRDKIKAFQIQVLKNRKKILLLLKFYSIGANVKYSYLSLEKAFEYAVMEYPFSFWQYGHDCAAIPNKKASIETITEHLLAVSNPIFFSDRDIQHFCPHYYQSATEMGYYGYQTAPFKKYLKALATDHNPMALFFPFDMTDKFDGQLLKDVNNWLATKGNKFLYIYGGIDTWSASAVPPSKSVDSKWFMLEGKHHGNARIQSMTATEREAFTTTLQKWLSMD